MRYLGPKNKVSRRVGVDLGLKTPGTKNHARLLKKLNIPPGQHGAKRQKKLSERGLQLKEKQKLRFMFGLTEKKLKSYFKKANRKKGNTAVYLANFLEKRLDNIVYRLGFAPTRASARQLVSHGLVLINDKKMTIPSYQVKVGEIIKLKEKVLKIPYISQSIENKDIKLPQWLEKQGLSGKLLNEPTSEEIEKQINMRLIIEYYSR